jgi:hypothetical protein
MPTFAETAQRHRSWRFHAAAKAEQRIIEGECFATKQALLQDRAAWRAYCREQGRPGEPFIPYVTRAPAAPKT